jgi:hypothetical protein
MFGWLGRIASEENGRPATPSTISNLPKTNPLKPDPGPGQSLAQTKNTKLSSAALSTQVQR